MAKIYNEQTITDVGEGVKAYEGNTGQLIMGLGKELDDYAKEKEREYNNSMNAYTQSMKNLTAQSMQDIYAQYENDPVKLQEEFNRLDNELINNIPYEDLKLQFKSEFLLDSSTYINRSKSNLKKQEEARLKQSREFGLVNAMNLRATALQNMMSGDASADDIVNFNKSMKDIGDLLSSKDAYGVYTFSPSQQDKYIKELDKSVGEAFVSKMYESDFEDLDKASKLLHENKYTVSYFDDKGNRQEVNIKDMVDAKTYQDIKNKTNAYYNKSKKIEYDIAYSDFMENPTQEGIERIKKLNPDISSDKIKDLEDAFNKSPNYEATTTYKDYAEAVKDMKNVSKTDFASDEERNAEYLRVANKVNRSNRDGNISVEDVNQIHSDIMNNIKDENKRDMLSFNASEIEDLLDFNLKQLTGMEKRYYDFYLAKGKPMPIVGADKKQTPPALYVINTPAKKIGGFGTYDMRNPHKSNVIEKMMIQAVKTQLALLDKGDIEGARKAKKEYKRAILDYMNPEIRDKKEGDIIAIKGKVYKIASIDDDVVLEQEK